MIRARVFLPYLRKCHPYTSECLILKVAINLAEVAVAFFLAEIGLPPSVAVLPGIIHREEDVQEDMY